MLLLFLGQNFFGPLFFLRGPPYKQKPPSKIFGGLAVFQSLRMGLGDP
jgi:hypothetical protein